MRPVRVTQTGVGASAPIPVDIYCPSSDKGVYVDVTGAATYTVQITPDDIYDLTVTPTWFNVSNANLVGATTDQEGVVDDPCTAIRINQTVGAGSAKLTVIQQSLA